MQLKDFNTLAEAREHTETRSKMVSRHVMNAVLAQAGLFVPLRRMQDDDTNPFQNAMAAFFDPGISEYNFDGNHPIGSQNVATLDAMIAADIGGHGAVLSAVKGQLLALSSETVYPFAGATLHAFLTAKGECPKKQVTPENGWLTLTLTADVEPHAPNIWHQPIPGHFVRLAGVGVVSGAGDYYAKVSAAHTTLWVDDAYAAVQ